MSVAIVTFSLHLWMAKRELKAIQDAFSDSDTTEEMKEDIDLVVPCHMRRRLIMA